VVHVQIGPSPLALGLLIPCTLAARFDVYVIGRAGDNSPPEYGHVGTGPEARLRYRRVSAFEGPDSYGDLGATLRNRTESREPMLITCTLREKIEERRALVEEILRARPPKAETVFLPCENAPHEVYEHVVRLCDETGALPLRTVVNRMCTEEDRDREGCRMVSAHSLGEWLIERPPTPVSLLDVLERIPEVELVDDYEARRARKLWMVNGAHQALAMIAWEGIDDSLEVQAPAEEETRERPVGASDDLRVAARGLRVSGRLHHLHAAMDDALQQKFPEMTGNLDYGLKHVVAYAEHPDSVRRVLDAFRRQDLTTFIKTMDIRLGQPAEICFEMGRSVSPFAFVFDVFESLALSLDAFLDAPELRKNRSLIDPSIDQQALQGYAALVGRWMPREQAKGRVQRLASALASHT